MKSIRIGNDIRVVLTVRRHGRPECLNNKDIVIRLCSKKTTVEITDFKVDGDQIVFTWYGSQQQLTGAYYVTLFVRNGQKQNVEDTPYLFNLVASSMEYDDGCDDDGCGCSSTERLEIGVNLGPWGDSPEMRDYNRLRHRPSINEVLLEGDLSLKQLGIQPAGNYVKEKDLEKKWPTLNGEPLEGEVDIKDMGGVPIDEYKKDFPSINGQKLKGNKSLRELGIQPRGKYVTIEHFHRHLPQALKKEDIDMLFPELPNCGCK